MKDLGEERLLMSDLGNKWVINYSSDKLTKDVKQIEQITTKAITPFRKIKNILKGNITQYTTELVTVYTEGL